MSGALRYTVASSNRLYAIPTGALRPGGQIFPHFQILFFFCPQAPIFRFLRHVETSVALIYHRDPELYGACAAVVGLTNSTAGFFWPANLSLDILLLIFLESSRDSQLFPFPAHSQHQLQQAKLCPPASDFAFLFSSSWSRNYKMISKGFAFRRLVFSLTVIA